MIEPDQDLGSLLEELKIQMIEGRGPWLAGNVSLEYGGRVIVTSGKALRIMLEKTGSAWSMIHVRGNILAGQRRHPYLLYSEEYEKLFLTIVHDNDEYLALKHRIRADYNIKRP